MRTGITEVIANQAHGESLYSGAGKFQPCRDGSLPDRHAAAVKTVVALEGDKRGVRRQRAQRSLIDGHRPLVLLFKRGIGVPNRMVELPEVDAAIIAGLEREG